MTQQQQDEYNAKVIKAALLAYAQSTVGAEKATSLHLAAIADLLALAVI